MLDVRSTFMLAALFVTWVAVVLLLLVVGNLRVRLQRLEQSSFAPKETLPFGQLLGKRLNEVLGELPTTPRVLIFLSANCASCKRVLGELKSQSWTASLALAWINQQPQPVPDLPPGTIVLDEGPQLSAALGVRVTPFAIVTNEDGQIIKASPINSVRSLGNLVGRPTDAPPAYSRTDLVKEVAS